MPCLPPTLSCDSPADLSSRVSDAPALGCAILAAVAAGLHPNITTAVTNMVHVSRVIQPSPERHSEYQRSEHRSMTTLPAAIGMSLTN